MILGFDAIIGVILVFVMGGVGCLFVDIIDKRTEPGYIPRRKRLKQKH